MKRLFFLLLVLALSCEKDEEKNEGTQTLLFPSNDVAWLQVYGGGVSWLNFGLDDSVRFVSPASLIYGEGECAVGAGSYALNGDSLVMNPGLDAEKSFAFAISEDSSILSLHRESATTREFWDFLRDDPTDCAGYAALSGVDGHFTGRGLLFQGETFLDTLELMVWAEQGFVWLQSAQNRFLLGARVPPGAGSLSLPAGAGVYRDLDWASFYLKEGTLTLESFSALALSGSLTGLFYDPSVAPSGAFDPDLSLRLDFDAEASVATGPRPGSGARQAWGFPGR